jgi:transcriptional regulator with XRE-family HTH domain
VSGPGESFLDIDKNVAVNLRMQREVRQISQEELAQRMTDRGFGFSQATIWKIEQGKRPVKISEMVGLGAALGLLSWSTLTDEPASARHEAQMERAHRGAAEAYRQLKHAVKAYLEAQIQVSLAAREAYDAGVTVTTLWTGWLDIPAEQVAIEARIEDYEDDAVHERIADAVDQVVHALRDSGFEAILDPAAITFSGGASGTPATDHHDGTD